jgi:hypothetical protein
VTAAELAAAGWIRCFIADEPRLSEAVADYEELGLEVLLLPVPEEELACAECLRAEPERYRLIFTRPRRAQQPE